MTTQPKRLQWKKLMPQGGGCHVARARFTGVHACRLHGQDYGEVFWIEQGRALHQINGKSVALEAGALVFVRLCDQHGFSAPAPEGFVLVNIAFSQAHLEVLRQRYFNGEARYFWDEATQPPVYRLSPDQITLLGHWTRQMDLSGRSARDRDRLLLNLFHWLEAASPMQAPGRTIPEWLQQALAQLHRPEILQQGTRGLAHAAARTPEHVNSVLKQTMGMTATEAVNKARMRYAAHQLRMSTKKILEICMDCGLDNPGHFHRLFRQAHGMTPRAYRLEQQVMLTAAANARNERLPPVQPCV